MLLILKYELLCGYYLYILLILATYYYTLASVACYVCVGICIMSVVVFIVSVEE